MNTRRTFLKTVVFLSVMLLSAGAVQIPQSAWASMEDAAIFYEELDQHGEWVDYGNYGPVWYPTQVEENWRPYVDGRWTPAEEGYVFETREPWGWATYHYGNWMPTDEYGWVWVPGRTWYPNTVTWRTSPESESPGESYIGWAPIPPPNYTPEPGYYPEDYYGGGPYRGPFESLITAPFWIFVKAASFLLGFSEPYAPSYSYWDCGCLAPPPVVPYYYRRTVIVHNYYTPDYYPRGIWAGSGYYNWGPPIPYVARVTRIKQVTINNYVKRVNIYQRRNVAPPPGILARRAYFRGVLPPAMVKHRPLPRGVRVRDVHRVRGNLAQPHLVKADLIKNAPAIRGHIPKTQARRESAQWRHGVPGAALPASAMMRETRQMKNNVRKISPSQRIQPVSPSARQWHVHRTPEGSAGQPARLHKRQDTGPKAPAGWTPGGTAATGAASPRMRSGAQTASPAVTPGTPGVARETRGPGHKTLTPEGVRPQAPYPSRYRAGAPLQGSQPGKRQQPGTWNRQTQTGPAAITPGQPHGQIQQPRYTPGRPAPRAAAPAQVQPRSRHLRQQPAAQPQPKRQQKQGPPDKKYTPGQSRSSAPVGAKMIVTQPRPRQYQPQPSRQVRQQPASQPRARPGQQARPQPKAQVRQQRRPQPQIRVQQQPRSHPRPQVRQQPRAHPQPQARQQPRARPQRQVRQQPRPQPQVRHQARPQPRPQVRQQSRPQPRSQAQKRPQAQPQKHQNRQVSEHK